MSAVGTGMWCNFPSSSSDNHTTKSNYLINVINPIDQRARHVHMKVIDCTHQTVSTLRSPTGTFSGFVHGDHVISRLSSSGRVRSIKIKCSGVRCFKEAVSGKIAPVVLSWSIAVWLRSLRDGQTDAKRILYATDNPRPIFHYEWISQDSIREKIIWTVKNSRRDNQWTKGQCFTLKFKSCHQKFHEKSSDLVLPSKLITFGSIHWNFQ